MMISLMLPMLPMVITMLRPITALPVLALHRLVVRVVLGPSSLFVCSPIPVDMMYLRRIDRRLVVNQRYRLGLIGQLEVRLDRVVRGQRGASLGVAVVGRVAGWVLAVAARVTGVLDEGDWQTGALLVSVARGRGLQVRAVHRGDEHALHDDRVCSGSKGHEDEGHDGSEGLHHLVACWFEGRFFDGCVSM